MKKFIEQWRMCEQVIGSQPDDDGGGTSLWQYTGTQINPITGDADLLVQRLANSVISEFETVLAGSVGDNQEHIHRVGLLNFPHTLYHEIAPGVDSGPAFLKSFVKHENQANFSYWIAYHSNVDPKIWTVMNLGDYDAPPDFSNLNFWVNETGETVIDFFQDALGGETLRSKISDTSSELRISAFNRRVLSFEAEEIIIPLNNAFRADLDVFPDTPNYRTIVGAINYNFESIAALPAPGQANTSSNEGGGEGLALAKVGVNLPQKTLVAGANITLTPGAQILTIAAASGNASLTTVETFNVGETSANSFLTGTTPSGALTTLAVVPMGNITVNNMACWIAQNYLGGTLGLAIYSRTGLRIAYTLQVAASIGLNVIPLIAGVALTGNQGYYFALSSDINSIGPLSLQNNYNPPSPSPPLSFYVPSVNVLDPTGFPPDISGYFGSLGSAQKYWMAAYT